MSKFIFIISIIILNIGRSTNQCKFNDGIYKVVYDEDYKDYSTFKYKVQSDTIEEITQDVSVTRVIEWISENEFHFNDLPSVPDNQDDLDKKIYSLGKPFYRLTTCQTDTIGFELRRNEHIIIYSGKFIKTE